MQLEVSAGQFATVLFDKVCELILSRRRREVGYGFRPPLPGGKSRICCRALLFKSVEVFGMVYEHELCNGSAV